MKNQKGQSLIEFAMIMPLFFAMCFAMIYGGILFMDYLQWNNAARAVARAISLTPTEEGRNEIASDFEAHNSEYIHQLTKMYSATPDVNYSDNQVTVKIDLTLNEENVGTAAYFIAPKELKTIEVIMPIEKNNSTTSTS